MRRERWAVLFLLLFTKVDFVFAQSVLDGPTTVDEIIPWIVGGAGALVGVIVVWAGKKDKQITVLTERLIRAFEQQIQTDKESTKAIKVAILLMEGQEASRKEMEQVQITAHKTILTLMETLPEKIVKIIKELQQSRRVER